MKQAALTRRLGIASTLLWLTLQPAAAWEIGDGYDLGDFHFSGYSNLELDAPNHEHVSLDLEELSLFVSGKVNRFLNPFLEAEISRVPLWEEGRGIRFDSAVYSIERLYNDILITDHDILRIGKMLTPVGEWNRIHAAPLVWTTIRPATTNYSFAEYASGIAYRRLSSSIEGLSFDAYAQPFDDDPDRKQLFRTRTRSYDKVGGFNVDYNFALNNKLGFSGQYAKVSQSGEDQWLLSVDGQFRWNKLRLEFQATAAQINGGMHPPQKPAHVELQPSEEPSGNPRNVVWHNHEWGGYLQLVHNFYGHWNLVGRGEYFQPRDFPQANHNELIGLVYRPTPSISYKFEYLFSNGANLNLDSGFYSSIGLMF